MFAGGFALNETWEVCFLEHNVTIQKKNLVGLDVDYVTYDKEVYVHSLKVFLTH